MRIRTVKPEFFTHPEVVACSIPARLLFLSLLTQADDEGRLYNLPRKMGGEAFGDADDVDVGELLAELEQRGRILRYVVDGKPCIQVVNFRKHQAIPPTKSRPSVVPAPPGNDSADEVQPDGSDSAATRLPDGSGPAARNGTGNREVEGEQGSLAPAAQSRSDPLFEAFCSETSVDWHELSDARRGAINGMVGSLRERGATPELVAARAEEFRHRWP